MILSACGNSDNNIFGVYDTGEVEITLLPVGAVIDRYMLFSAQLGNFPIDFFIIRSGKHDIRIIKIRAIVAFPNCFQLIGICKLLYIRMNFGRNYRYLTDKII